MSTYSNSSHMSAAARASRAMNKPYSGEHHAARPERPALGKALAEVLKRGHTLNNTDLKNIVPHYGYHPDAGPNVISGGNMRTILANNGVELSFENHRSRTIYVDGNLPLEETDIAYTKAAMDGVGTPAPLRQEQSR